MRGWGSLRGYLGSLGGYFGALPSRRCARRIPALSGALDELYRDFRGLKEQLGRLSDRFAHLEASVEQLSRARGAAGPLRRGAMPQSPRRAPGTPQ